MLLAPFVTIAFHSLMGEIAQGCGHLCEVGDESCGILSHAQERMHFRFISGWIHLL